ncbi:hypothetical protein B0H14DRAFT_3712671 [Mycena olivaceomarginata]|nr:hypothetical protein B0H14DRAFT_3712671 [Mycena olivaceomarginata]
MIGPIIIDKINGDKINHLANPLPRVAPPHQFSPSVPASLNLRPAAWFQRRDTHQPNPQGPVVPEEQPNLFPPSDVAQSTASGSAVLISSQNDPGSVSRVALDIFNTQLAFVERNNEHGHIASGFSRINDSLVDELINSNGNDFQAAQSDTESEPSPESLLHQYLSSVKKRIKNRSRSMGSQLAINAVTSLTGPKHPVFALAQAATLDFSPNSLYERDVFVWLPHLLPGHPDKFKCFNDNPIARRVRRLPDDYFLLTNRFLCDSNRTNLPGCGQSFQGTDPHIIGQLPRYVQEAFPAYISTRGALDKQIMWEFNSCIVKRVGPSPFSQLVSELQRRHHARIELMYYSAAIHFGLHGKDQIPQFSAFANPAGYAGCPPSTGYFKAMFADWIGAHRFTWTFLKYMGGVKGEKIWKAAYSVANQFEEVRAESLTLTKSLSFVREMLEKVQASLKLVGHPPTALLYTDSPQQEQGFHEAVTASLSQNVQHISTWSDLPALPMSSNVPTCFCSDSMRMEEAASEILEEAALTSQGNVYLLGLVLKFRNASASAPNQSLMWFNFAQKLVYLSSR